MASNPTRTLDLAAGLLTIHRLSPDQPLPPALPGLAWYSVTRTAEEVSIVAPADFALESERQEPGWRRISVRGPLDFSDTGILAGIAAPLAEAGVSIFVLSTFDTDHILVRDRQLALARKTLTEAGYPWRT